jgi:hypothetical protein
MCQADRIYADRFHLKSRWRPVWPVEVGSHSPVSGRWREAMRSNAFDRSKGMVAVPLHRLKEPVCLAFPGDGVGLPEDSQVAKYTSMVPKLAAGVAHQPDGKLNFRSCQRCRLREGAVLSGADLSSAESVEHRSGADLMSGRRPAAVLQE